jgi:predicted nucleotidyltransferase
MELVQKVKNDFVPDLTGSFGDDLKAVILYGSAAKGSAGAFVEGVSDVNLLVLTGSPHPEKIIELGKRASRKISKLRLSLHFLTVDEFLNSSDVFPMEYLDIEEHHEVIWGEKDPVKELGLHKDNLRHQVEERLRGGVNSLRQALLASRGKDRLIAQVLKEWFGSQTALFRAILRLKGHPHIPAENRELVRTVAELFELDPDGIYGIIDLREKKKTNQATTTAVESLRFLTALVREVDSMDATGKKGA